MRNKQGYTLLESLIVLSIISMLITIFPFVRMSNFGSLGIQMKTLQAYLLQYQAKAISEKKIQTVSFSNGVIRCDEHILQTNLNCNDTRVVFHENGNVQKAQTIKCSIGSENMELVVLLGSGRTYVK